MRLCWVDTVATDNSWTKKKIKISENRKINISQLVITRHVNSWLYTSLSIWYPGIMLVWGHLMRVVFRVGWRCLVDWFVLLSFTLTYWNVTTRFFFFLKKCAHLEIHNSVIYICNLWRWFLACTNHMSKLYFKDTRY